MTHVALKRLVLGAAWAILPAVAPAQDVPAATPDDLLFSAENMDRSVAPGDDFYRYANGAWNVRVARPDDQPRWGILDIIGERVKAQVAAVAEAAGAQAASAPKGAPTQQVGDFFNAYMNLEAIEAAGMAPLAPALAELAAVEDFDDMTRFMAAQVRAGGANLFNAVGVGADAVDGTRYALYVVGQSFGIDGFLQPLLAAPEGDPRRDAYRAFIADTMRAAGDDAAEAERIADLSLDIETRLYAGFLTPAEGNDPAARAGTMTLDEVQALIPAMDVRLYLDTLGYAAIEPVYMMEPRALPALAEVWATTPMADLKAYARFRMINAYRDLLPPVFAEAKRRLDRALLGAAKDRPRIEEVPRLLASWLPHPTSRLYVEAHFDEAARAEMEDIVARVHAEFGERIATRDWLTEETRAEALAKHAAMEFAVGHPDAWIDYSGIDIGAAPVANVMNIAAFFTDRDIDRMTGPVVREAFANVPPIIVNAAYMPAVNRFEVAAAIVQAPVFSTDMDPALKFCRLGAIAGHEMTHGFDSGGRKFDAKGDFRDWWTPADAAAFEAEARKLNRQAEAWEALPGLPLNGPLTVKENMADVGGVTLGRLALLTWLEEHPEDDVILDGLTQEQRCFVAWAQMWATQASDAYIRSKVAADFHPPGRYRAFAALQHLDAFHAAFGIEPGDPMWLPPEQRVNAW